MSQMKRALEVQNKPILGTNYVHGTPRDKPVDVYVLSPTTTPEVSPEERAAQKRRMMAAMTGTEGTVDHGYEHVPIEVLRTDKGILELLDMLETCRPGGSQNEEDYIAKFIKPYTTHEDDYGNVFVLVKRPSHDYPHILWSSHTDTVHRHDGTQKVEVTNGVAWTSDGSCLGADDTVGNWLALEMIRAQVPGVYAFHRDEESGGGGSSWLAREQADWLGTFDAAIALDRAGYADVITHQGGTRCCSQAFAKSLAKLIGGKFKPDDSGVFTDTANYTDLIGECTNLSVGYFKQHGPMEHTNLGFAYRLRDALIAADWSQLVLERKAGEIDPDDHRGYGGYFGSGGGYGSTYGGSSYGSTHYTPRKPKDPNDDRAAELYELESFIVDYPWVVAEFLHKQAVTVDDLDLFESDEDGERW